MKPGAQGWQPARKRCILRTTHTKLTRKNNKTIWFSHETRFASPGACVQAGVRAGQGDRRPLGLQGVARSRSLALPPFLFSVAAALFSRLLWLPSGAPYAHFSFGPAMEIDDPSDSKVSPAFARSLSLFLAQLLSFQRSALSGSLCAPSSLFSFPLAVFILTGLCPVNCFDEVSTCQTNVARSFPLAICSSTGHLFFHWRG